MRTLVLLSCLTAALPCQEPIPLWPDAPAPEGAAPRVAEERGSETLPDRWVRNVHRPTLTPYLPDAERNTGAAVVVCPGGGYAGLALDKEGHEVARWLQSIGVAGLVLEYRLPRPEGHVYGHEVPVRDAWRALALTRERAEAWHIDPDRVGIMGFSAGGHLASTAGTHPCADHERPSFLALIYPVVSLGDAFGHRGSRVRLLGKEASPELVARYSNETRVTATTPPAFLVSTSDDGVKAENALAFYQAMRQRGITAELHVYQRGGHGYGLRAKDRPVGSWHLRFAEWLRDAGWLERRS